MAARGHPAYCTFVVAFFGCCGAIKENKCMMYTYGFLLFVILIAQVIGLQDEGRDLK